MAKYKPGLHKDLSAIFHKVSIPDQDGVWALSEAGSSRDISSIHPVLLTVSLQIPLKAWPALREGLSAEGAQPKRSRFAAIGMAVKWLLWRVLPSGRRRREKRLRSTSKHLLINLPR